MTLEEIYRNTLYLLAYAEVSCKSHQRGAFGESVSYLQIMWGKLYRPIVFASTYG